MTKWIKQIADLNWILMIIRLTIFTFLFALGLYVEDVQISDPMMLLLIFWDYWLLSILFAIWIIAGLFEPREQVI